MRPETTPAERSVALATGAVTGGAGQADSSALTPRLAPLRLRGRLRVTPVTPIVLGARTGRLALAVLVLGALALAAFATGRGSPLVPRSQYGFPHWESGPLHFLFGRPTAGYDTLNLAFSGFMVAMAAAYALALLAIRALPLRLIVAAVLALHVILLMAPPMQLTDLFNYLGYARLGAVHHLNPYAHTMLSESYDPVYLFSTWHNLKSPYGPLFTALSYPIALLPLPVAYWALKLLAVAASLGFIALLAWCAKLLGRDPKFALLFVAANPIYLFYAVGGFHNDFFMLIPSTAAIGLLLARRDRSAGAVLMLAVAVKFTAILLLPFLLIAARPPERRLRILQGVGLATVPLAAMSLALFGAHLPNLQDQSTLLTPFSVPNVVGLLLGVGGGTPVLLRVADALLVPVVLLCLRRRRDWIAGAGWSTLALVCTLAWLMPWYVIWCLPLAALGTSVRLRAATLALTGFLLLSFMPATGMYLNDHRIDLLNTPSGNASQVLQARLSR